jgi:phosphoglucosamine mutase
VGRLFGTDGVRGVAGTELTPELALGLASAAAEVLLGPATDGARSVALVARDPRPSGEFLEAAVVAGLLAAGVDVVRLGVVPTPAVAQALADAPPGTPSARLGVMISASHNPMPDNGIKLFGPGGGKLDDATEDEIEARLGQPSRRGTGAAVGRVVADLSGAVDWYVDRLVASAPARLDGLRLVVDCANGAAGIAAPAAYRAAGADVTVINADPSGYNINDGCGATHLTPLQDAVRTAGAAAGIAHDGDADRCMAVDATGNVVDGDHILAILALALKERGALHRDAVAATVMSNLGLRRALAAHGIALYETAVGDRYVLERMQAEGLALGGEQSGHVILADHAPTGDGILTGLHLLARVAQTGQPLAELASVVEKLPQVLVNVTVADKGVALTQLAPLTDQATADLGDDGRVLVRASGTEPLIRVMVEATTESRARDIAESLASAARGGQ